MPKQPSPVFVAVALIVLLGVWVLGLAMQAAIHDDPKPVAVLVPEATITDPGPAIATLTGTPTPAFVWPRHCRVVETRTYSNNTGSEGIDNRGTETITTDISCEP